MKPHVLLIEPMMPEAEAQLDAAYCVHRLFASADRAALIAAIGSSVRAIVTGGAHGAANGVEIGSVAEPGVRIWSPPAVSLQTIAPCPSLRLAKLSSRERSNCR